MKNIFRLLSILVVAVSISTAQAYTLAELESRAMTSHPTLQAEVQKIQALEGKKLQAGLGPNPVFNYLGSEMGNDGKAGFQGGSVSQEIVTAGKLQKDQAVVDQEILAARYDYSVAQLMVIKEVRQAAFEVMAARRIVDVNEKIRAIAQQTLDNSEALYKSGQINLADIYLARLEMKNANLEYEQSTARYWNAWKKLACTIGTPDLPADVLEDVLDVPSPEIQWEELVTRLESQSPELSRAQTNYFIASAQYHAEVARRTPNVTVEAGMQYDCSSNYTTGLVTVSVPIPFRNKNQGAIAQAQAQIGQAQSETESTFLTIQKRLADAFTNYKTAKSQLEWFKNNIEPDLQQTLNATLNGYKQGEINALQLQTVQKNFFMQVRNNIQVKAQMKSSEAEIESFFQL